MDTNRHGGHLDLGRMSGSICDGENIHWSTGSRTVISLDRGSQARSKRSADCGVALDLNSSRSTGSRKKHDCRDPRLCVRCMIALVHSQP